MKTSTKTVISINNISKVYEGPPPVRALDGVSLEIKEGDFVSIVGQSGSGKSTFLNMIGLLDSITDGSIEIEGKDVSELSDNELSKFRGEKIGFIFQSFFLLPGLTAQENVAEGLLYQGISRSERLEKAKEVVKSDSIEDIKSASDELTKVSHKLAEKMYAEASKAQEDQATNEEEDRKEKKDEKEEVIDAEFTDK